MSQATLKPLPSKYLIHYIEVRNAPLMAPYAGYDYKDRMRLPPTPMSIELFLQYYPDGDVPYELVVWGAKEKELRRELLMLSQCTVVDAWTPQGLWPWQRSGVRVILKQKHLLLADQMGTGKTVTALAALRTAGALVHWESFAEFMETTKVLILCPRHKILDWCEAARKWLYEDVPITAPMSAAQRKKAIVEFERGLFVTNWEALWATPELLKHKWAWFIGDEAHRVKNRKAKRTKALQHLRPEYLLLLTGTPVERAAHDLWSLLKILDPNGFPSYWAWAYQFCVFGGHPQYPRPLRSRNLPMLWDILQPHYLRRTRMECFGLDDPPIEITTVQLSPAHLAAYNRIKADTVEILGLGKGIGARKAQALSQVAVHPDLLDLQGGFSVGVVDYDTGKLAYCVDLCVTAIEEGERPVVYCVYRRSVELLIILLAEKGLRVAWFYGGHTTEDMHKNIGAFRSGDADVLVSTVASGGEGTDLPEATLMIFMTVPWSSTQFTQAISRMMRPREDLPAVVLLAAHGTVDRTIIQKVTEKGANVDATVVATAVMQELLQEERT